MIAGRKFILDLLFIKYSVLRWEINMRQGVGWGGGRERNIELGPCQAGSCFGGWYRRHSGGRGRVCQRCWVGQGKEHGLRKPPDLGKLIFLSQDFLSTKIISITPSSQGCRKD